MCVSACVCVCGCVCARVCACACGWCVRARVCGVHVYMCTCVCGKIESEDVIVRREASLTTSRTNNH